MPRKTQDLAETIDRIMTDAAARIAEAVRQHQAEFTASLNQALENLGLAPRPRPRPRRKKARSKRIRTADVALELQTLLQATPGGLRWQRRTRKADSPFQASKGGCTAWELAEWFAFAALGPPAQPLRLQIRAC